MSPLPDVNIYLFWWWGQTVIFKQVFMLPKVENYVGFCQYKTGFLWCSKKQEFFGISDALWNYTHYFSPYWFQEKSYKWNSTQEEWQETEKKKKKRKFYVASHYSKNTSALNNEKNIGPIIEVIYDEGIIWVNERNSLKGRKCIILPVLWSKATLLVDW